MLAEAIWIVINADVEYPRQLTVQYVLDGGSQLQRLPWKRGSKFPSVYDSYVSYVAKKYNKAVVVFDGYEHGPAPKDVTHHRRTGLFEGTEVKLQENMALVLKKEVVLADKKNRQRFINILGQKLEDAGFTVHHAAGDADRLIVKKAVELSETTDTILVGEDTDLLVLLLHYASQNTRKTFLCPEPKQNATRKSKVWDIQLCQQALGSDVCESILFIHAILGCDTTSSLYGIGKGLSLKVFMRKEQFKQQAITFSNQLSSKEQIAAAGERALAILYNRKDDDLDPMRYSMFCDKLVSSKTQIKPEVLPPTSSAAKYHSCGCFVK